MTRKKKKKRESECISYTWGDVLLEIHVILSSCRNDLRFKELGMTEANSPPLGSPFRVALPKV